MFVDVSVEVKIDVKYKIIPYQNLSFIINKCMINNSIIKITKECTIINI